MAILRTERVTLRSFGALISSWVDHLSIGRAKMVVEQLHQAAKSGDPDRLIALETFRSDAVETPLAAVVAIVQPAVSVNSRSDVATVVHAGPVGPLQGTDEQSVITDLSEALDQQLRQNHIRFAQWATDEVTTSESTPSSAKMPTSAEKTVRWCDSFGFQPIGTLDYLCGPVSPKSDQPFANQTDRSLIFRPISWSNPDAFAGLIRLVEKTYTGTLDCPELAKFRTTEQVLMGYRASEAFEPQLWFVAVDRDGNDVGSAIFAAHPNDVSTGDANSQKVIGSIEIVYMGLVPEYRGHRYGQQLVQKSFDTARQMGASQVLLAVDRANAPAKSIYLRAGLKPVINETVWVKLIDPIGQ